MEPPFACVGKSLPGVLPPVHLVFYHPLSVSMGRKGPRANPFQTYLVFYHLHRLIRDEDNGLLERPF